MTERFRRRVLEYIYFARHQIRDRAYIVFNSKAPKLGAEHPRDAVNAPDGLSAVECLFRFESEGVLVPCREQRKLMWLMAGKYARDWHITEWARGLSERIVTAWELFEDRVPVSLIHSAQKSCGMGQTDFEAMAGAMRCLNTSR